MNSKTLPLSLLFGCLLLSSNVSGQEKPVNNDCTAATPLELFEEPVLTVLGTTIDATADDLSFCGENIVRSPGVWFRYQTFVDKIVQVSTCDPNTDFDTAITLFSSPVDNNCDSLQCVDGKDDDSECGTSTSHSTMSWRATAGTEYYIQVHGSEEDHTGEFNLVVTEDEPLDDGEDSDESSSPIPSFMKKSVAVSLISSLGFTMI